MGGRDNILNVLYAGLVGNALDLLPDTTTRQRIAPMMYNNIPSIKSEFGVSGVCRVY